MTTFDATQDFQATQNPNGVWSSGYSEAGGASYAFIPFDKSEPLPRPGWTRANYNTWGTPTAWRNLDATTTYGVGVGQLCLHPGPRPNGDHAILRFTAPKNGTYRISGQFFAGDLGSMNARIVLRGKFDAPLQVFISTTDNAVINVPPQTLNAGDTVDFLIGNNGSYGWGSTPVGPAVAGASIRAVSGPPQRPAELLQSCHRAVCAGRWTLRTHADACAPGDIAVTIQPRLL